jgi:ABC-type dipeptide/oligopeptide/nickel transport system permease component
MVGFFLRRLLLIPIALVLVHFVAFAFAHVTYEMQMAQTIFGSGREGVTPVWPVYAAYVQGAMQGDFGRMPIGVDEAIADSIARASLASLGLLALAFGLSIVLGLVSGLWAVRVNPPRTLPWLTVFSTVGLAMPSFYTGTLLVGGLLYLALRRDTDPLLPVAGFGWDVHLLLPVLALTIRPAAQVARVTGSLLAGELDKRYVVTARSIGHTWRAIQWDKALRNVLAPVFITVAGSFRLLVAELVLVEWLFDWPGIGRMLVHTLVPPTISHLGGLGDTSVYFMNPPIIAGLLVVFALWFILADSLATGLARIVDPRLRLVEEEPQHE